MAETETHQIVTKVWIAPGCIVCDACENDCPEVFDVQEETCLIRPPALKADFLAPLTPSIIIAAEGCPVDVIKFDLKEVPGPAPWAGKEQEAAAVGAGAAESKAHAPAGKKSAPRAAGPEVAGADQHQPDQPVALGRPGDDGPPKLGGRSGAGNGAGGGLAQRRSPDLRAAVLAAGGAYSPATSLGDRIREAAGKTRDALKQTRRQFSFALAAGWGALAFAGVTSVAMFQDFFGPKVLKEPRKRWPVGPKDIYLNPADPVNEAYKRTPDGGTGFWIVYLQDEGKLVAISTICTHLGCIPNWLKGDSKFKCPCHGSGYYMTGVNFEGPTPRPLERFKVYIDTDGQFVVDQSVVFREELGEWENTDSYVSV